MGRWLVIVVTAALVVAGSPDSAGADGASQLHVRVYDNTQLPRGQLAAALLGAGRLLAPVGLEVDWHNCSPSVRVPAETTMEPEHGASCNAPLAKGELAVRVVHVAVPPEYRGRLPLGDSLIDRDLRVGVLATIYYERVRWLAREANVAIPRVLGHAIAHELAHLIIGSARHARTGLMRPVWSREDLERDRPQDWRFTPPDAEAIRARTARTTR